MPGDSIGSVSRVVRDSDLVVCESPQPSHKDLIAQHSLTDDEYGNIAEILGRGLICIGMDS